MLTINGLSKSYGDKILFDNINLSISKGEKIGLIGPNGAGKSTLFSLIIKELENPSGQVHFKKNIRIGYLPQEAYFSSSAIVMKEVIEENEIFKDLLVQKEKLELEEKMATTEYAQIISKLEEVGYFEIEHKAKKILIGLGLKESNFSQYINQLSSGFRMRVLLAKLLLNEYDILLLDEPTNYLDLNATLWLKDFLKEFKGTFIIISHDRDFLEEVTNITLILEEAKLIKFKGNYQQYLRLRTERKNYLLRQAKEQEKKIKQLQRFIERFSAHPNKASQVKAKKRFLEKIKPIVVPEDIRESIKDFEFPKPQRSGYVVLELKGVSKSYQNNVVYKNLNFEVLRGEKAILVGENGVGKSTLLKILAGVTDIDCGRRIVGYNVSIGYFSQSHQENLNLDNTVLEEIMLNSLVSEQLARNILGIFFFKGNDVYKKISVLSGGEKSRLVLAKLLINPPNLLLLDEPTTHLDMDATYALIKALQNYEGTIVFISHNIYFIRSIANVVYYVKPPSNLDYPNFERIKKIPGNFDYYLQKKEQLINDAKIIYGNETTFSLDKNEFFNLENLATHAKKDIEIAKKISKLKKEKEKLESQRYVKKRILSNPFSPHSKEVLKTYEEELKKIENRILAIEEEIKRLKSNKC
ncbi:MAG: ATP-binding cassette domain-containing protein [Candidatus Omnitrophica bacterium]|nr:ATP-binding cassette domain-containing protein [Candidatus Omnitrophota bacterium]MCM8831595.1 ATP-binding cassette domain-containing protein [Candidatus Omnitrophota bacterium]